MKFRKPGGVGRVELPVAPMINVVFLLLAFFLLNFKPRVPEENSNAKMASAGAGISAIQELTPVKIRLIANRDGTLAGIRMGERPMRNFGELNKEIIALVDGGAVPAESIEVEFDCDYGLHYDNVVRAISAVSGYTDSETQTLVKLVDKIKFAPPRAP